MIEIDPNTTVTERFLKFFKELHLKKQPNLNELVISVQNYCEQLNSGRVKYLRDKILLISENIDSKSLDLEHKKLLSYIKTFLDSYSQIVKDADPDILDEILNPEFEELNESYNPVHLNIDQEEILGLTTLLLKELSINRISNNEIFRFCSRNFRAKKTKKKTALNSYNKAFYNLVYHDNKIEKGLEFTENTKRKVQKLLMSLNAKLKENY